MVLKEAFGASSSAKLLTTFCYNILKKGRSEKLSDEAVEETLENMCCFLIACVRLIHEPVGMHLLVGGLSSSDSVPKINSDGCWYNFDNRTGSVFHDSTGVWILDFYRKLACNSNFEAEIWAIYRGLTIILEKGMTNVEVEPDLTIVVKLIKKELPSMDRPDHNLIENASDTY